MRTINTMIAGLAILSLVSMKAVAAVDAETEAASKNLGAAMVSEVSFDEGKTELSETAKADIRGLVESAKESGKIDELKVATWADREYPGKNTKASKADIDIAKKRAENIKSFVKKELQVNDVNTYNMTERPNALQKFFRTPTAKMKTAMEQGGAAPKTQDETGFFGQKGKASKAVIMVYME